MSYIKRLTSALFNRIEDNKYYESVLGYNTTFNFEQFNQEKAIDDGYAKNADLYSIVRKIASSAALIPLDLYEIKSDGEKELITEGELYELLQQPNRLQSMPEYLEEALTFLLLNGNSYTYGTRSMGFGDAFRELNVLSAPLVNIITGDRVEPIKAYEYQDLTRVVFPSEEIMHTKYPNPKGDAIDRLYGLSPLQAGNMALQSNNNVQEANANIITNQGASGILSSGSERSLKKEEAEVVQDAWDKKQKNPAKFGRTLITSAQLNYLKMGLSSVDLQLLESGVMTLRSMCNVYSVPSQLFNDTAGTTFNNMNEAKKSLYTEAVLPNMNLFLTGFNNWFIKSWSEQDGKEYCVIADTSGIEALQKDQKEEADKDKVITDTVLSVLESDISNESKVQTLIYSVGMSEDEAQLLVGDEDNRE